MCGSRPRPHRRHSLPRLRVLTDLVCPSGAKPIKSASNPRRVRAKSAPRNHSPHPRCNNAQHPVHDLGPIHLHIQFHPESRPCHPAVPPLKQPTRPHQAKHLGVGSPSPDSQAPMACFEEGIRPRPSRPPRGPTSVRLARRHSPPQAQTHAQASPGPLAWPWRSSAIVTCESQAVSSEW